MAQRNQRGIELEWLNQLKEVIGDNEAAVKLIESGMEEVNTLRANNKNLAEQAETWQKRFNEGVETRDTLKRKVSDMETKLSSMPASNDEFQKQFDQLKSDYETKLSAEVESKNSLQSKLIDTMRKAEFSGLNLAAHLPKGLNDDQVKSLVNFMQYELSAGLDYDGDLNTFVYKNDGVPVINPDTTKPYTLAEKAQERIKSGAWDSFINTTPNPSGASRGNVESGGGIGKKDKISTKDANRLMEEAFKGK